ncbi:MAG: hypothetical protein BWX64_01357 [Acidobacteria bacterium ADurb.Bin051]|nr:MAG: hypothetical protein BWX64_01357 [Acidobacteria bacterium ADurb.Bin051]
MLAEVVDLLGLATRRGWRRLGRAILRRRRVVVVKRLDLLEDFRVSSAPRTGDFCDGLGDRRVPGRAGPGNRQLLRAHQHDAPTVGELLVDGDRPAFRHTGIGGRGLGRGDLRFHGHAIREDALRRLALLRPGPFRDGAAERAEAAVLLPHPAAGAHEALALRLGHGVPSGACVGRFGLGAVAGGGVRGGFLRLRRGARNRIRRRRRFVNLLGRRGGEPLLGGDLHLAQAALVVGAHRRRDADDLAPLVHDRQGCLVADPARLEAVALKEVEVERVQADRLVSGTADRDDLAPLLRRPRSRLVLAHGKQPLDRLRLLALAHARHDLRGRLRIDTGAVLVGVDIHRRDGAALEEQVPAPGIGGRRHLERLEGMDGAGRSALQHERRHGIAKRLLRLLPRAVLAHLRVDLARLARLARGLLRRALGRNFLHLRRRVRVEVFLHLRADADLAGERLDLRDVDVAGLVGDRDVRLVAVEVPGRAGVAIPLPSGLEAAVVGDRQDDRGAELHRHHALQVEVEEIIGLRHRLRIDLLPRERDGDVRIGDDALEALPARPLPEVAAGRGLRLTVGVERLLPLLGLARLALGLRRGGRERLLDRLRVLGVRFLGGALRPRRGDNLGGRCALGAHSALHGPDGLAGGRVGRRIGCREALGGSLDQRVVGRGIHLPVGVGLSARVVAGDDVTDLGLSPIRGLRRRHAAPDAAEDGHHRLLLLSAALSDRPDRDADVRSSRAVGVSATGHAGGAIRFFGDRAHLRLHGIGEH